jgi:TRAP-type mannitol/chloroaromatic compound transport system permease large subunit
VVLVLYAMIARQPVGQLWLAGLFPGLMMAGVFIIYIVVRCKINPSLGPALSEHERQVPMAEKLRLLGAGLLPVIIFATMMVPFVKGWTSSGRELCHRRLDGPGCGDFETPHDLDCI